MVGEAEYEKLLGQLKGVYGGSDNVYKLALLNGLETVNTSRSIKDMEITPQRALTEKEIRAAFKMPKILNPCSNRLPFAKADRKCRYDPP